MTTIAITGASGFVGSMLRQSLTRSGHEVLAVERETTNAAADAGSLHWNTETGEVDLARFERVDAIVHLAGANVAAGRWTKARKQAIHESRGPATRKLCEQLSKLERPPVFVGASATGIYDESDEPLTEASATGQSFLAKVARDWELGAEPLRQKGARVVHLRIGLVMGKTTSGKPGGALARMHLPFKLGLGGRLGNGRQHVSWISLTDLVRLIEFSIDNDKVDGALNATAPGAVTNREFTKAMGRALHRPTIFPVPAFLLRLLLGEMADELLLASRHIDPVRTLQCGFQFEHPDIDSALASVFS